MALTERLKSTARAVLRSTSNSSAAAMDALLQLALSRELARLQADVRVAMPDNPAACGFDVLFPGGRGRHHRGDLPSRRN